MTPATHSGEPNPEQVARINSNRRLRDPDSGEPKGEDTRPPEENDNGLLRVYQCPRWLADGGGPERHCGYIQAHPGVCPYDHGEVIALVEIVAVVQCSDCGMPIPADDGRAPDGRLICAECQFRYIGEASL